MKSRFMGDVRAYWLWGAGTIFALALGGWLVFGGTSAVEELLVVEEGEFLQQVSVSGKVVAEGRVDLGFSLSGRISRVYTVVGARTAAGQTLAELENGDLRAAVLQKEAALETAQADLDALLSGTRA